MQGSSHCGLNGPSCSATQQLSWVLPSRASSCPCGLFSLYELHWEVSRLGRKMLLSTRVFILLCHAPLIDSHPHIYMMQIFKVGCTCGAKATSSWPFCLPTAYQLRQANEDACSYNRLLNQCLNSRCSFAWRRCNAFQPPLAWNPDFHSRKYIPVS